MFLVGSGPLPAHDPRQMGFPALRARQFLVSLLEAGHDVAFAALVNGEDEDPGNRPAWRRKLEYPTSRGPVGFRYHPVPQNRPGALLTLRDLRHEFAPDVVVSAGPFMPMVGGARAAGDEPLWIDVPGDPMSEAQLRAHRSGQTEPIHRYRQVLSLAVGRGDHFSVISADQRKVLIGALGLTGRLTASVVGQELVDVVRPSVEGLYRDCPPESPPGLVPGIAADDFAVLFCGGFNTWLDAETLLGGVLKAMDRDPHVHWVSTGGSLAGHHEGGYTWFRRRAERSPHVDRFHFLGWVPARHLDAVYEASDLALNMDTPCYEAEFGSRTRLLDAVERGLAVAATDSCELTAELRGVAGFHPLEMGNADLLSSLLIRLAGEKRRRRAAGNGTPVPAPATPAQRPWSEVRDRYSIAQTTAPLLRWLRAPEISHGTVETDVSEDQWLEIARLQERLEEVWRSPTWRYLGRVHKAFNKLRE